MPAGGGLGPAVALQRGALGGGRHRRGLVRVEAHHHHLELLAGVEVHALEAAGEPVEGERAEHRAAEVDQRQDDRPLAEVVADAHGASVLVAEQQVRGHPLADPLIETELLEGAGHAALEALGGGRVLQKLVG